LQSEINIVMEVLMQSKINREKDPHARYWIEVSQVPGGYQASLFEDRYAEDWMTATRMDREEAINAILSRNIIPKGLTVSVHDVS
jgi:hypothetical protein